MSSSAMLRPALASRLKSWILSVGPFWAASIAGHLILLIVVALAWGTVRVAHTILDPPISIEGEIFYRLPVQSST